MQSNIKRYLAMVDWQLRNLPKKERERIIQDLHYDMELKRLREGLTEDELILSMENPAEMAKRYGGKGEPMYASDVEQAEEAAYKKERERLERAKRRKEFMEEEKEGFKRSKENFEKQNSSIFAKIAKGIIGFFLAIQFLKIIPGIFGIIIGIVFSAIGVSFVLPIIIWTVFFVIRMTLLPFKIIFSIFRGFFSW